MRGKVRLSSKLVARKGQTMSSELSDRIQAFLSSFENVFHYDWDFTKDRIVDELFIEEQGTFLDPLNGQHFTGGKGDNWANRSCLIADYRELRAFAISEGLYKPEDEHWHP